jgi:hypothetical protein
MADWKQITARIRRAKGSKDPAGQLCNLFQKTRDAMVAFELARHLETINLPEDAVKWYAISWQRFRRGDWKTKSEEGVLRLGGALPAEGEVLPVPEVPRGAAAETSPAENSVDALESAAESADVPSSDAASDAVSSDAPPASADATAQVRGRRRGRRGGRNRRKSPVAPAAASTTRPQVQSSPSAPPPSEVAPPRVVDSRSIPRLPVEAAVELSGPGVKGRFADPGLSSRISLLEMQFRRLLTCAAVKLDQADRAPAGPGVFVLTDDDMTEYVRYTTPEGEKRERVLWHCLLRGFNHGTQHRSEAAALLTQVRRSPGDLDMIFYAEEVARSAG